MMASSTDGESCWICLCEEPDESGPLRRDCSCRGHAGFAHLSCLINYAEDKSNALSIPDHYPEGLLPWAKPWEICPNCEQEYQHELALDLANSLILFVENNSPRKKFDDNMKKIEALRVKNWALDTMDYDNNSDLMADAKGTANKLLTMVKKTKTMLPPPDSTRYNSLLCLVSLSELLARNQLAGLAWSEGTQESYKEAMEHFKTNGDICQVRGFDSEVGKMEAKIDILRAIIDGEDTQMSEKKSLKLLQLRYEESVKESGVNSAAAIKSGVSLAKNLWRLDRGVEAERLLTKLVASSQRLHGPEHDRTKDVEGVLVVFRRRIVRLIIISSEFQALRYEDDGKKYVVQGPISDVRSLLTKGRY